MTALWSKVLVRNNCCDCAGAEHIVGLPVNAPASQLAEVNLQKSYMGGAVDEVVAMNAPFRAGNTKQHWTISRKGFLKGSLVSANGNILAEDEIPITKLDGLTSSSKRQVTSRSGVFWVQYESNGLAACITRLECRLTRSSAAMLHLLRGKSLMNQQAIAMLQSQLALHQTKQVELDAALMRGM